MPGIERNSFMNKPRYTIIYTKSVRTSWLSSDCLKFNEDAQTKDELDALCEIIKDDKTITSAQYKDNVNGHVTNFKP